LKLRFFKVIRGWRNVFWYTRSLWYSIGFNGNKRKELNIPYRWQFSGWQLSRWL